MGIAELCSDLRHLHHLLAHWYIFSIHMWVLVSNFCVWLYVCLFSENSKMLSYAAQLPTEDPDDDDYETGLQEEDEDEDFHQEISSGYAKVGARPSSVIEMVSRDASFLCLIMVIVIVIICTCFVYLFCIFFLYRLVEITSTTTGEMEIRTAFLRYQMLMINIKVQLDNI